MAGIALPYVSGMQQCSFSQQHHVPTYTAILVSYHLYDQDGKLIDCISFRVGTFVANASDIYDRAWTGTREDARNMARGLLESGYILDRENVRMPTR